MNNRTTGVFSINFLLLSFLYFTAIISTTVAANYFFKLGEFICAGGIFIFPWSFLIGTIIGEVYNYSYQRIVVIISIICQFIFVIHTHFFISLQPAIFFHKQTAYQEVFNSDVRYFIFAIIGLYFAELINVFLLTKWKCKSPGRSYIFRAFFCIALSQLGLSVIVNIGAFIGKTGDLENLLILMFSNYGVKMVVTGIFLMPCVYWVNYLKKVESINYYDVKTKFSPFSIKIDNVYNSEKREP